KAALWHEDHAWAAAAVALTAAAAAVTALCQRREGWAFAAALGVNLAVSLLVWRHFSGVPVEVWWVPPVHAIVAAPAAAPPAWPPASRHLYPAGAPGRSAPLLSLQILLAVAGNVAVLLGPAVQLVRQPDPVHPQVLDAGLPWGWVALALTTAAAAWHAGRVLLRGRVHVLCALGVALAVLAACTAGHMDRGNWLAYHVLTAGLALTGAGALAGGSLAGRSPRLLDVPPSLAGQRDAAAAPVCGWVTALAVLLVGLALRGAAEDPAAPWWSAGPLLAA